MKPGPAPVIDLMKFVPQNPEQAGLLFVALVDLGDVTDGQARSIIGTLLTLPERVGSLPGMPDGGRTSRYTKALSVTLVRYRKVLARLGIPPWEREATLPYLTSERELVGVAA